MQSHQQNYVELFVPYNDRSVSRDYVGVVMIHAVEPDTLARRSLHGGRLQLSI